MASLKDIFGWFSVGKVPTADQFKQSWSSFWHKSEQLPIEQVLGLNDSLNNKASKEDFASIKTGLSYLQKDTMENMINLSPTELDLLKTGFYQGIELMGYYTKGDKDPIVYTLDKTSTKSDNGGSVIVLSSGERLVHDFNNNINVLHFGAKGDNSFENKGVFENIFSIIKPNGVIEIPVGRFKLTDAKFGKPSIFSIRLLGKGISQSTLMVSSNGIGIVSEQMYFEHLRIEGIGYVSGQDNYLLRDERNTGTADFDLFAKNCMFENHNNVVYAKGRGINITDSLIRSISHVVIDCDFPTDEEFIPGPNDIQTKSTGFRGIVFNNNRVHYCALTLIQNDKNNRENLRGVSIVGNQIEGGSTLIKGYVNDCTIKSNVYYNIITNTNFQTACIQINSGENISIDIDAFNLDFEKKDRSKNIRRLAVFGEYVKNISIKANIRGVLENAIWFMGGGDNIDINIIADDLAISDTNLYHLVAFGSKNTSEMNYSNVKISGIVRSPASNFTPLSRIISGVYNRVTNFDVSGLIITGECNKDNDFFNDNLNNVQRKKMGTYVGDGTSSRLIDVKYRPKKALVFSDNSTFPYHRVKITTSSALGETDISLVERGFQVSGGANTSGVVFYYETD